MKSEIKTLFRIGNSWRIKRGKEKIRFLLLLTCFLSVLPGLAFAQWSSDPAVNTPVVTAASDQTSQKIIHDSNGGYFVVWQDARNAGSTQLDIYAQYFNAAGEAQWAENGIVVCDNAGTQWGPKVILDWAGGIIVSWSDDDDGYIYAQRIDVGGNALWAAGGVPIIVDDHCAWMATDGANGAIVVGNNGKVNRVAVDGSLPWGNADNPVVFSTAAASYYSGPKIMSDGAGGAILVWEEGDNVDIAVQRVNRSGDLLWNNGDPVLLTDTGYSMCPGIITDGAGGAIIIWMDDRNKIENQLYAQRVNSAGAALWTANGVQVTDVATDSYESGLASDNSGGAFVTFVDTADSNLYAQRIGPDGSLLWAEPVQITDTGNFSDTSDPPKKTVEDGSGGFITVWKNGSNEIMAHRVDGAGTPLWTANGVVLCNAAGSRGCPRIETNGQGGAVAVWNDYRNSNQDIFIQGINAAGVLGEPGFVPMATVTSSNATVSVVLAPDAPAGAPADFIPGTLVSFTATLDDPADTSAVMSLTFSSLPANPVIYKVFGETWKMIYPRNTTTGISNISLNGNTLSFTIADGSDCDVDGLVNGIIQDPVAAGSSSAVSGSSGCFITTVSDHVMMNPNISALITLIGLGFACGLGYSRKPKK